jgi:hypothetical protein
MRNRSKHGDGVNDDGVELGNEYDMGEERDRWQMYSKQLQVKQEVLQRTMK